VHPGRLREDLLALNAAHQGVAAQVEFESKVCKRSMIFQYQGLGSRRFQLGFDMVNQHRRTRARKSAALSSRSRTVFSISSRRTSHQGLTLVHLSAQRKRSWWDKGYLWGVWGVFKAGVEGVFRRLGDV